MVVKAYSLNQLKDLIQKGTIKDGPTLSSYCQFLLMVT